MMLGAASTSTTTTTTTELTVPVVFTTRTQYVFPFQRFMIPASWRRYQLSQLVNKALSLPKVIPFDFLVRGELLVGGSLAEWCTGKGIGLEETLEVEYFESVMPPSRTASIPHDDWISSVSCQLQGHFVTASYDGIVRVFDSSQNLASAITGHTASVTSVCVLPALASFPDARLIASASHDMTARLHSFSLDDDIDTKNKSKILSSLHLHTSPISSVCSSSSGQHLLTAGWDTLIGVWTTSIPSSDEVAADPSLDRPSKTKRRKLAAQDVDGDDDTNMSGSKNGKDSKTKRKAPINVLKSHTDRVMKAIFVKDDKYALSCGLDSTVRMWDVEMGVCLNTLTASEKPFLDLAITLDSNTALAASTDRTITLYDIRSLTSSSAPSLSTLTSALIPTQGSLSHPALPSCIAASPTRATQVVSGGYDGVVRMWDLRSLKVPVAVMKPSSNKAEKGGKVLGIDWGMWGGGVVGVGNEKALDVWRVNDAEDAPA